MSGTKTIRNETGYYINMTLNVRKGSNPQDHLKDVNVSLDAGQTETVQYGDDENPYLNGLRFEYKTDDGGNAGSLVQYGQQVITRGSAWDNTLNQNSTLTISAVHEPVSGSN